MLFWFRVRRRAFIRRGAELSGCDRGEDKFRKIIRAVCTGCEDCTVVSAENGREEWHSKTSSCIQVTDSSTGRFWKIFGPDPKCRVYWSWSEAAQHTHPYIGGKVRWPHDTIGFAVILAISRLLVLLGWMKSGLCIFELSDFVMFI